MICRGWRPRHPIRRQAAVRYVRENMPIEVIFFRGGVGDAAPYEMIQKVPVSGWKRVLFID